MKQGGAIIIKNALDVVQKKEEYVNECPVFEIWRNRTKKKIGCSNIRLWLDNN